MIVMYVRNVMALWKQLGMASVLHAFKIIKTEKIIHPIHVVLFSRRALLDV